jgi:A/G-specific adenine glycosylase
VNEILVEWYRANARDLPWRRPGTTAWGVLLSEVMSQQTPVARVAPIWEEWLRRWPDPASFAAAGADEVLRAWGTLGYPRRALRLLECARTIVAKHDGEVPDDVDALLALPGVGDYTARAIACFHFGQNVPVVDTNVRRVHERLIEGNFLQPPAAKAELKKVAALLPDDGTGPTVSVAVMELGATVCTARSPECEVCPVRAHCAWQAAGRPAPSAEDAAAAKKRVQKFVGTDRQVRGKIMAVLRSASEPVDMGAIDAVWPDASQRSRALFSLIEDGLAEQNEDGRFHLPV